MTGSGCEFPREWLIGLRDGELKAAQLEIAEVHLHSCDECRGWMSAMDEVDRLLRDASPYLDDPIARAEIKARAATPQPTGRPFGSIAGTLTAGRRRWVAAGLTALALIVLAATPWREPIAGAGTSISGWLRQGSVDRPAPREALPSVAIVAPSPRPAVMMPLELKLVEATGPADAPISYQYRNAAGLTISYEISCPDGGYITLPPEDKRSEIAGVEGRDVLVLYGVSRDRIVALFWNDNDQLHSVFVLTNSPPLSLDDGLRLVAALMHLREGGAAPCGE